jgi:hypothetical protein
MTLAACIKPKTTLALTSTPAATALLAAAHACPLPTTAKCELFPHIPCRISSSLQRYIDEFDGVDGEDDIKAEIFARGTLPECSRRVRYSLESSLVRRSCGVRHRRPAPGIMERPRNHRRQNSGPGYSNTFHSSILFHRRHHAQVNHIISLAGWGVTSDGTKVRLLLLFTPHAQ